MDIHLRIKEIREAYKMTGKEFATSLKIDSSQYSKIENGKLMPTLNQLMEINSIYRVSLDWLLTGIGKAHILGKFDNNTSNDVEVLYQHKSKAIERFWNEQEVPLYELDATAGLSTIFSDSKQNIINFI